MSNARWGPSYLFKELLVPHLRETYADTLAAVTREGGADLLVSHQIPLTAPLVAEKTGVKWISAVLFPIAFASAYEVEEENGTKRACDAIDQVLHR